MDDPYGLGRFVAAQADVWPAPLEELRRGRKQSHWMWFVFPQVAGLGMSAMSQHYAIRSRAEAAAYLAHDLLGPRLAEATDAVLSHASRLSAEEIFGGIDAVKFRSSMTLFDAVAPDDRYRRALDAFHGGEPDPATLELLD
ncbi:DUF1810 domain-containing protein [Sphingosinicella sp. YJ22]|uniref:DUF1810 domain-containing protein n=1 Tax=Sphingosinicella sp. YJ22 TaxID=1104780 RepID=UPI00140BFA82|nr:DUF1810 domain-containing protein [Sphingosinicella sp. YJ22]